MKNLWRNKPLLIGLVLLLLGQLFYLFGFKTVYAVGFLYVIAIWMPYPAVLRSVFSRLVAAIIIGMSLLQLVAALQFFLLPTSDFRVVSVISTLILLGVLWLGRDRLGQPQQIKIWAKSDTGAVLVALAFALPLIGILYLKGPAHLTYLGGVQSPDGSAHYAGLAEMTSQQHLDYQTVDYYPKGFHDAGAFILQALHASPHQLSWQANAQVYFAMYLVLGVVLAALIYYLCIAIWRSLGSEENTWAAILLALSVGPLLAMLYLVPFVYDGFLNYYYICAAVVLGSIYLYGYRADLREHWRVLVYLLLAFGVGMSWGPLLTPALLLAPLLYIFGKATDKETFLRPLRDRSNWPLVAGYAVQLLPLYLHFRYAHLATAQGITAEGIIRSFHFGFLLVGIAVLAWIILDKRVNEVIRQYAINVLGSFYVLVALLVAIQYFAVGELRYYAIKTAFTVELLIIAVVVTYLVYALCRRGIPYLQQLLIAPTIVLLGAVLLIGVAGANPLLELRQVLRAYNNFDKPSYYSDDVVSYTKIATSGKLAGASSVDMHYSTAEPKIYGDSLLDNWVGSMLPLQDTPATAADCTHTLFMNLAYGVGKPEEQTAIVAAAKQCIAVASERHVTYYIVTDNQSKPYLQAIFGDQPVYVTPK